MSLVARDVESRQGFAAAAIAAAGAWLLRPPAEARPHCIPGQAPVVVVAGLAPRCGATTVARGLAATLAHRHPAGTATVVASEREVPSTTSGPGALALGAAGRMARDLFENGLPARAAGQLALVSGAEPAAVLDAVRGGVPVVIDTAAGWGAEGAATLADAVVLVAHGSAEPALAAVVARALERVGPPPFVAANRAEAEPWTGRADVLLPDARAAARVAQAGRRPTGGLGRALGDLASRVWVEA